MIKSVHIKNFRSIKELKFYPKELCSLVGPNSVGKTNILKAIDLVLGEGWTTKAKVARELFNDPAEPIEINIIFNQSIQYEYANGNTVSATGVRLVMNLEPLHCEVKTLPDQKFLSDDFKKKCHFIYIPSQRDLSDQMRVSNWTLLGKMMKEIHRNYISAYQGNEQSLKDDLKEKMQPAKAFIEADFDETAVTFKKFVDTFKKNCDRNSVGLANKFEPELNVYNLNWFYKTLQIQVTENSSSGKIFDAEDLGSGLQNLILISIFQTYAELMKGRVIFGIEEPEIFLYPQAQRSLYENFQTISKETQIFYTTHNPNFVSACRAHELEILQKNDDEGTFTCQKNDLITEEFLKKNEFQIYSQFNNSRNELFFAKKILLVEGASDKILFETLLKKQWGIDINVRGISIIECTGKGGVIYFSGVCDLLNLDYFSVWDKDEEEVACHDILKKNLSEKRGLELDPNLEEVLRRKYPNLTFSSDSSKKVKQAYDWAYNTTDFPEEFSIIKKFVETSEAPEAALPTQEIRIEDIPF